MSLFNTKHDYLLSLIYTLHFEWKKEDNQLVALIKQERCNTLSSTKESTSIVYVKIAANLNSGRSAKQCRDRWQNFLRDGIKKGDWTVDEEELIKDLYATFGAK